MKLLSGFSTMTLVLFGLLHSCDTAEPSVKGQVSFSFHYDAIDGRKNSSEAKSLLITLRNSEGMTVQNRTQLTLYEFNGEYLSEPLPLEVGDYQLTEFLVLSDENEVLYLTPLEDSDLAYLVNEPLPIDVSVTKDQVTNVNPEVIELEGHNAAEFGYTTFSFNIVNTLQFYSAAFVYNETTEGLELTEYNLVVTCAGDTLYNGFMPDATQKVMVKKDGYDDYTFAFSKAGYASQTFTLSKATILADHATDPITIVFVADELSNGLVAHYTFAGGTANDLTGNGNDGVVSGPVSDEDNAGTAQESMKFDSSDDYIKVSNPSFLSNNEGTFTAWVKFDDLGHTQYIGSVGDEGSIESYISFLRIDGTDNTVGVYQREVGAANWVKGTTVLTAGVYYHLTLISDGSSWRIFINGVEETLSAVNGFNNGNWISDLVSIDNFVIGSSIIQPPYTIPYMAGNIDEVRLYDRVLSVDEIQELYQTTH